MSCCGQRRRRFREPRSGEAFEFGDVTPVEPPNGSVFFEYVGGTAMTVGGPESGRSYRFGWPGAQVAVDLRDAKFLTEVPNLRQVKA